MLRRLGAVQLDTISVLARSHELVAYSRLGAIGRPAVEKAYWSGSAFEYWCHAACILPIEHWPVYAFRRRAYRERKFRWHEVPATVGDILDRVRRDGPLTTGDIGGAKKGGPWWDWSDSKISIEFLLDVGDVVCVQRVGWRRVYDLAERAIPAEFREIDLTDEECVARLTSIAGRSLAVATRADLVDYTRVKDKHAAMLDDALLSGASGLVPVNVTGWPPARKGGPQRLGRPRGAGPRRGQRPPPHHPAQPLRLPDLGAGPRGARLRHGPPPGGLCAEGQAHPRLFRDARPPRREADRPRRPGPRGHHLGQTDHPRTGRHQARRGRGRRCEKRRPGGCTGIRIEEVR